MDDQLPEALGLGLQEVECFQPAGGDRTGRGLALTDFVAVDHQDLAARVGDLAGDCQPGKTGATDDQVVPPSEVGLS